MYIQEGKKVLIKKFFKINNDLYKKGKDPLKCHGPDHHMRVWRYALYLAKALEKRGQKIDYEILIPACFLHDLAAYNPGKTYKGHHQKDVDEAGRALKKIRYPKEKFDQLLAIIGAHGSDPQHIKIDEPIEATILRDADKMDIFGPLGIARIIMPMTRRGFSLEDIVKKFYHKGHLKRKFDAIKIKQARDAVRKNYKYSMDYFKRLDRDLST